MVWSVQQDHLVWFHLKAERDQGKAIPCHKAIGAMRSPEICARLLDDSKKGWKTGTVPINNTRLHPRVFRSLIQLLYTDRVDIEEEHWDQFCRLLRQLGLSDAVTLLSFEKASRGRFDSRLISLDLGECLVNYSKSPEALLPVSWCLHSSIIQDDPRITKRKPLSPLQQDLERLLVCCNPQVVQWLDEDQTGIFKSLKEAFWRSSIEKEEGWSDIVLRLDDSISFRCHKFVLSGRSDYFSALINGSFSEKNRLRESKSSIPELRLMEDRVNAKTFWTLLLFLYTDDVSHVRRLNSVDDLLQLLYLSDMHFLPKLKSAVVSAISDGFVDLENVFTMLEIASRFENCEVLEKACIQVMSTSLEDLIESEVFADVVRQSAASIVDRQDTDSIPIIDEIRSFIQTTFLSPLSYASLEDHSHWLNILSKLDTFLSNIGLEC